MVAEGLAQTALHNSSVTTLFSDGTLEEFAKSVHDGTVDGKSMSDHTALELALSAQQDSRFNGLITFEESPKFKKFLTKPMARDLIREYALSKI